MSIRECFEVFKHFLKVLHYGKALENGINIGKVRNNYEMGRCCVNTTKMVFTDVKKFKGVRQW